jgi:hypothetical protein
VETRHVGGHIVPRVLKRLCVPVAPGGKIILKNPLTSSEVADLDKAPEVGKVAWTKPCNEVSSDHFSERVRVG